MSELKTFRKDDFQYHEMLTKEITIAPYVLDADIFLEDYQNIFQRIYSRNRPYLAVPEQIDDALKYGTSVLKIELPNYYRKPSWYSRAWSWLRRKLCN
jgi:hypothetical protein